jgi:hypothetical protein
LKFGVNLSTIVFSALASIVPITCAGAQQTASSLTPEVAVVAYCAAWNTADRAERLRLLAQVWAPDGVYSDPEPTLAVGRAALSNAISTFHHDYPGMYFRCSAPQVHHGVMRVTWILFRPDGSERLRGTDFSELAAGGRIRRVTGFFGAPPGGQAVNISTVQRGHAHGFGIARRRFNRHLP